MLFHQDAGLAAGCYGAARTQPRSCGKRRNIRRKFHAVGQDGVKQQVEATLREGSLEKAIVIHSIEPMLNFTFSSPTLVFDASQQKLLNIRFAESFRFRHRHVSRKATTMSIATTRCAAALNAGNIRSGCREASGRCFTLRMREPSSKFNIQQTRFCLRAAP